MTVDDEELEVMVSRVVAASPDCCPVCDYDGIWETQMCQEADRRHANRTVILLALGRIAA